MFDLNKITPVLEHLKQIVSPNMFKKISQKEIMIHCPFCDDALRKNAANHGHLYISTESPIFNCFRCNSSGTLLSLLIQTGFDDRDVLDYISSFIKVNFTKDYLKVRTRMGHAPRFSSVKKAILNYNLDFKRNYYNQYNTYINYIHKRIGEQVDETKFLLSPLIYKNKIVCRFTNSIGENVLIRYIDDQSKRYVINKNINSLYYFQDISNIKTNKVTICEGPFDIINLSLYNDFFKDNIFISINGKNYVGNIEKLILMYYLTEEIEFNIVFDSDYVKNSFKILKTLNLLVKVYSGKIWINAFKPLIGNDVSDFPAVERIGDKYVRKNKSY